MFVHNVFLICYNHLVPSGGAETMNSTAWATTHVWNAWLMRAWEHTQSSSLPTNSKTATLRGVKRFEINTNKNISKCTKLYMTGYTVFIFKS